MVKFSVPSQRWKNGGPGNWSGLFKATTSLVCLLGSLFCTGRLVFSLMPCWLKFPLWVWESHAMSWLLSLCPLRCNLCHSLSCSVSRKQGPLPLPPSFQLLPGKGRGICSSCSSRSGYGSLMAVFLKSGHGSLHGCFSCCISVTLHPPSTLCLGVEKAPHCW